MKERAESGSASSRAGSVPQSVSPLIILCVRATYGSGILSSLFGAEIFEMPREMNTLPTTKPFNNAEVIRELVQKGMPDLENGFGARVWAFAALWQDVCRAYPKIAK